MNERAGTLSGHMVNAGRLVDSLVIGGLALVAGLGIWLSSPARLGFPDADADAQMTVAEAPEFYPWVRPPAVLPRATLDAQSPLRTAPSARPAGHRPTARSGFLTRLTRPLRDAVFHPSTYSTEDSFYGGPWSADNIAWLGGAAQLDVRRLSLHGDRFSAAEMATQQTFGYGRYEAVMRPARGSGIVTAFFTYTGESFGDPHDEIDIEFLGTDTTRIHFNYFRHGKRGASATFDLPFDASRSDRLYAFEWRPDGITWFVENEPIYSTLPGDTQIPVAAGKVVFSAWTGKPYMRAWHGEADFGARASARFACVSFTPMGETGQQCSDTYGRRYDN